MNFLQVQRRVLSFEVTVCTDGTCSDNLPPLGTIDPRNLLTVLCEKSESPPFSIAAKTERALRKNTMESIDFENLEIWYDIIWYDGPVYDMIWWEEMRGDEVVEEKRRVGKIIKMKKEGK